MSFHDGWLQVGVQSVVANATTSATVKLAGQTVELASDVVLSARRLTWRRRPATVVVESNALLFSRPADCQGWFLERSLREGSRRHRGACLGVEEFGVWSVVAEKIMSATVKQVVEIEESASDLEGYRMVSHPTTSFRHRAGWQKAPMGVPWRCTLTGARRVMSLPWRKNLTSDASHDARTMSAMVKLEPETDESALVCWCPSLSPQPADCGMPV